MARILRGDIRWADLNPVRGQEQAGNRPVLVLSQDIFKRALRYGYRGCPHKSGSAGRLPPDVRMQGPRTTEEIVDQDQPDSDLGC